MSFDDSVLGWFKKKLFLLWKFSLLRKQIYQSTQAKSSCCVSQVLSPFAIIAWVTIAIECIDRPYFASRWQCLWTRIPQVLSRSLMISYIALAWPFMWSTHSWCPADATSSTFLFRCPPCAMHDSPVSKKWFNEHLTARKSGQLSTGHGPLTQKKTHLVCARALAS